MGKISEQSSLGTRQATAEVELIYGGVNYRQAVSILFTGFYPADNDATLAANSSSLVPTQAAVKSYVDSSIYGLKWKQSVRAATTAALTLATDFENGDIIDGYTLQTGDRILIKNQVSAIDNGIYVVAASGAPTRAVDADSGAELVSASVMVERGTVNADTQWTCTANTITVGVSNITWAQITSSGVADSDYGDIVVSSGVWALDSAITFSGKTLTGGTLSGVAISGASSIATTVSIDANTSAFTLHDNSDTTKTATFGVGGISTGTNRQFQFPNTSGTIALTSDISDVATQTHAATGKTTPVDADEMPIADSAASFILKKLTWANLKATLKTYLDTLYQPVDSDLTTIAGLTATTDNFIQAKSSAWASRTVAQVSADLQATGLVTDAVGFRTIPQNSQSAAYTTVAADSGKHILHPSSDTNARTFTIDSNANVAYPVGTCITFVNQTSQVVTIAITSDTMTLAGTTTTGSRSLAQNGVATALKVASTSWVISGTGLT